MNRGFFLIMLIVGIACRMEPKQPVLNTDQMARILADLYYLEAAVEPLSLHIRDSVLQAGRYEILTRHGISDTLFEESGAYFKTHPRDMKEIEDKVVRILEEKENKQATPQDADN
jgi:hypothetical protein